MQSVAYQPIPALSDTDFDSDSDTHSDSDDADPLPLTPAPTDVRPTRRKRRARPWLAVLLLPARVAVGALTLAGGYSLVSFLNPPLPLLSSLAATAAGQFLISLAISRAHSRGAHELALAQSANNQQRMQWLDAIQAVGKIVDKFSNGLTAPLSVPSLRNVFLDVSLARLVHFSTLLRRLHIARTRPQTRADVLENGRHFLDFALASYGFMLLSLMGVMHPDYDPLAEGMRGQEVAVYMLRLSPNDVVVSHLDGEEINLPRHFVALDHSRNAVVVSIRGTNSISDIITDLICANEPFQNGYAHAGMRAAAETLCNSLVPTLRVALDTYPPYSIVVTGHSLGAGVAILLTKLLLENGFHGVKCYAFAPCPVFGPMHCVDTEWSDALECFVHADDIVSTLCLASARRLALEIERIDRKIELSAVEKRTIINEHRSDVIANLLNRSRSMDPDPREEEVEQLYIPCHRGVHWLIPDEDDSVLKTVAQSASYNGDDDDARLTRDVNPFRPPPDVKRQLQRARSARRKEWKKKVNKLRGKVPPAYVPMHKCGSYIVRPRHFEKILVTPGCVNAHFPNSYSTVFAGLDLPPRELPPPPAGRRNYTRPWYSNELG